MRIRIITAAQLAYEMNVDSKNFEGIVKKIVEQKYIKLDEKTVILTSAIVEIKKI